MRRRTIALIVAGVALAGGGTAVGVALALHPGDDGPTLSRIATDRPCPELDRATGPSLPTIPVGALVLRDVGRAHQPTSAVFAPDGSGDGLLGQRTGEVLWIDGGVITREVVLDLSDDTEDTGDGGLLGLAYDPDGRWLYVYRSTKKRDDVVTAYPLTDGRPDPDGERELLRSDHPDSIQHHGGGFLIGPDGMLYIGLGDGGGLGDPRENAEDTSSRLGKILRIDPTPEAKEPYAIPEDNPFVDDDGAAPEVWVLGVRNPFRLGLDPGSGDLWLGDVGQSCWEELDRLPTGAGGAGGSNLGWDVKEGTHRFEGGEVEGRELEPVVEYNHRAGWCSIVAGPVLRGSAVPRLDGWLLYTDYCKGQVYALRADEAPGQPVVIVDTQLRAKQPIAIVPGPHGAPWVLTLGGEVMELVEP